MILLGVDLGLRRIGFAVLDTECPVATPYKAEKIRNITETIGVIAAVFAECRADRVVLGHPIDMSGRHGAKAKEAAEFARLLVEQGIPAILWDERLTTAQAERSLREANLSRKQRKEHIDAVAAQRILESYAQAHNL